MANENIISPELEENQTSPATPARHILNQFFEAASTPFTAIHNQLLPQEVIFRDLERELDVNHSPSGITSTPSDHEPHIGSSSGGHQNGENEERHIRITEINLVHHQEEVSEDNIDSADDTNANKKEAECEEENDSDSSEEAESEEKSDCDLSEI